MSADPWRRAALELAAVSVERLAQETAAILRAEIDIDRPRPPWDGPIAIDPTREEGDEYSGQLREIAIRKGVITPRDGIDEQEGFTEDEYEQRR